MSKNVNSYGRNRKITLKSNMGYNMAWNVQ